MPSNPQNHIAGKAQPKLDPVRVEAALKRAAANARKLAENAGLAPVVVEEDIKQRAG